MACMGLRVRLFGRLVERVSVATMDDARLAKADIIARLRRLMRASRCAQPPAGNKAA